MKKLMAPTRPDPRNLQSLMRQGTVRKTMQSSNGSDDKSSEPSMGSSKKLKISQSSSLLDIDNDNLFSLFSFLAGADLANACCVCRAFNVDPCYSILLYFEYPLLQALLQADDFWQGVCLRDVSILRPGRSHRCAAVPIICFSSPIWTRKTRFTVRKCRRAETRVSIPTGLKEFLRRATNRHAQNIVWTCFRRPSTQTYRYFGGVNW